MVLNTKLIMQCSERFWSRRGAWGIGNGNIYTDLHFQTTWEASRGIPGKAGLLVAYMGGAAARSLGGAAMPFANASGSPEVARYVRDFLAVAKIPWPGIESFWNGRATLSAPWKDSNLRWSHACWRVGQRNLFYDYVGMRQGNCHFAGEHCSQQFQGFMEGAAAEGIRAAGEIISDVLSWAVQHG